MANVREVDAFLLSRQWRDVDDGIEIVLWARSAEGPVRLRVSRQEAVMFVPREATTFAGRRVPRPLSTLDGRPVDAVYFRSQRALVDERQRLREAGETPLESDVKPSDRYVMERFVTGALHIAGPCTERRGVLFFDEPRIRSAEVKVALSVLALDLDLETDGFGGPLLSAAWRRGIASASSCAARSRRHGPKTQPAASAWCSSPTSAGSSRSTAMSSNDAALSRAIKILMNSFYGVLGTPGCRFFDPRLPTSITRRGHAIIERARTFFEGIGLPVIYGDTDSLFVHVGDSTSEDAKGARGRALATELTTLIAAEIARDYRVESHLELRLRVALPALLDADHARHPARRQEALCGHGAEA